MVLGVGINLVGRLIMPGIFDDRDRGYEAKFAHDEEMKFKVMVRRNTLLGLWAAGELGLSGHDAGEYTAAIVKVGLTGKNQDRVFQKIRDDFLAKKLGQPDLLIHAKMQELWGIASDQVTKDLT